MASGAYIAFQLASVVHTGVRAGGSNERRIGSQGRARGWISAVVGFLMAAVFRLALAVVLIPIQAIVSLSQAKPSEGERCGSAH